MADEQTGDVPTREALEALAAAAEAQVVAGEYDVAMRTLGKRLAGLRAVYGPDDPRVAEVVQDLETVRQMRGVAGFGAQMGFRHWEAPKDPPGSVGEA